MTKIDGNTLTSTLQDKIIEFFQERNFLPKDELPHIPELKPYSQPLINFICSYINDDMKKGGLGAEELLKVFEFVFYRAMDIGWQWHISDDGKLDYALNVGNPFNDMQFLSMPEEMINDLQQLAVPVLICNLAMEWYAENNQKLKVAGGDIWGPLSMALSMTYLVANSILLKAFGYRD